MALLDFNYYGAGSSETTAQMYWYVNYGQGIANGGTDNDADTVGRGAVGAEVDISSLSNPIPTTPNDNVGTKARGYMFSQAPRWNEHKKSGGGMVIVNTGSGGANYPTNNADSTYGYSARAFLRLEQPTDAGNLANIGTNIGLMHKASIGDTDEIYDGIASGDGADEHCDPMSGVCSGYKVILSLQSTTGHDTQSGTPSPVGTNSAPRLVIVTNPENNLDNGGTSETCTGTYAHNTWYHVRFDMYHSGGSDVLKVYTAPISGTGSAATEGIGSETWTEVGSMTIPGASDRFISWTHTTKRHSGWFYTGVTNHSRTASSDGWDAYIERYQFLTKDLS